MSHSESQYTSSNLKEAWVRPTCWSWRASWIGWRQLRCPLGKGTLGSSHFEELFLLWWHQPSKCHFGNLNLSVLEDIPTHAQFQQVSSRPKSLELCRQQIRDVSPPPEGQHQPDCPLAKQKAAWGLGSTLQWTSSSTTTTPWLLNQSWGWAPLPSNGFKAIVQGIAT